MGRRAKLARREHSRRRKLPSIERCRAYPNLWEDRIAAISAEIERSEALKKQGEQLEALWRAEHRRTLALAANGGK